MKKKRRFDNGTTRTRKHSGSERWNTPKIGDVYAQFLIARAMLMRITDPRIAIVKREMNLIENLIVQFMEEENNGKSV